MVHNEQIDVPIKLKSPTRFVIVGPGLPAPSILVASSDDVSDLAGYYSIREAGFENIAEYGPRRSLDFFQILFRTPIDREKIGRRYGSVDVWVKGPSERKELYSLIFDHGQFSVSPDKIIKEFSEKLRIQIERLVDAYKRKNYEEVQYVGQIISTFMSLVSDRMEYSWRRARRLQRVMFVGLTAYICMIAIVFALWGFFKGPGLH